MDLLRDIIDTIEIDVRNLSQDRRNITKDYIESKVIHARNLLVQRHLSKNRTVSMIWQSICLPLERSVFHDCNCLKDVGCQVLKSCDPLPTPLYWKERPAMQVMQFDGSKVSQGSAAQLVTNKYSITRQGKMLWDIYNNHLIIFGNLDRKAMIISGIWNDPRALKDISICDSEGNDLERPCYNPETEPFPIPSDLVEPLRQMVLQSIIAGYQLQQDKNTSNLKEQ